MRLARGMWCAALLLMMPLPGQAAGTVIEARGAWAAIDRGGACEALSRALRIAAKGQVQALAGLSFTPDRRRWGEFHARLIRVPRAGSSVILTIGDQPFLLAARGDWAWSRGPAQEQAIIAALRGANWMRVEARDGSGRRFVDHYSLAGVPTAIDAAAARCAAAGAGKIQQR
jgi:hypothetical protein